MSVIVIAEAGVNHNGSVEIAKELIDAAAEAGADYIKFQTYKTERLVSKYAEQADYQKKNNKTNDNSQYSMLKKLELSREDHVQLIEHCQTRGIKFFSTAFDPESIEFLASLKLNIWKIPSGEITNYPYLKKIASYKQPVILSTGMCNMDDIRLAIDILCNNGLLREQLTVLHCTTEYPAPMDEVNLRAMLSIKEEFNVPVGYSDHTEGIEVSIAAVALGAKVIEKHFTLDRNMPGPDHKASIEPDELKKMISSIRNVELALGDGKKAPSKSELKNLPVARKSIVAAKHILQSELFTENNITVKRPGGGISPMKWDALIGKQSNKEYFPDDFIEI